MDLILLSVLFVFIGIVLIIIGTILKAEGNRKRRRRRKQGKRGKEDQGGRNNLDRSCAYSNKQRQKTA